MQKNEIKVLKQLKRGNVSSLKYLFDYYYENLYYFTLTYVHHKEIAEEIVQDVFIKIWDKRHELNITSSIKSYLYTSVKNKSISYLRQQLTRIEPLDNHNYFVCSPQDLPDTSIETIELEFHINRAIDLLPEKCKIIFNLSRNADMTYKEIARELDISPETVKSQISIALKKIKLHLEIHWDSVYY